MRKFFSKIWPSTIRTQLILGVALIHLLLMTGFIVDLVTRQQDFLKRQALEEIRSLTSTLAINSCSWVLANDVVGLKEIVVALKQHPELRYAMVITNDGTILAHTDKTHIGQRLSDPQSLALLQATPDIHLIHADQHVLDMAAPILTSTGERIGWARIAQGQGTITHNINVITRNGIIYTLLAIAIGSILAVLIGNRLTAGLHKILKVARQIKEGHRDLRIEPSGPDEIVILSEGFNTMIDTLNARDKQIIRNQQRLESFVKISQFQADTEQNLLDYALDQAIELTDSTIGLLSYYNEEKQELILNSWSKGALDECKILKPQTSFQLAKIGLWGEAIRQRKPIIVSDFQAPNPLKKGFPEGHVRLHSFLSIPIFQDVRLVAVIGVANKNGAYDQEDVTQLTLLMDAVWKIIERRRAQNALRESELRFKAISENFTAGMIYQLITRDDGTRKFTYVSDSVQQLWEITPDEALADATLIYRRVHQDDRQRLQEAEAEAARTLSTFRAEVRIIEPSGHTRWSSLVSTPTQLEDGSLCWNGIELVITDRKQAAQALAQAAKEWSAAMDANEDIICLLNPTSHIVRANMAFYRATGTSPETAIGEHITTIMHPEGGDTPCRICKAQKELRDLQIVIEADEPNNPVGLPIEVIVKIIRDQDIPTSIFMAFHDLSVARREMEEKASLEKQLQQAQKMESVGRLAGGVAHDFNNMLSAIIGYTELAMSQTSPDDPLHLYLAEIHKAGKRSADLTRQLLTFARKQTIEPKVLDLNETVEGMLKMLRRLIGEDILLHWQPATNLGRIKMDPSQIDQILANLCVNARDAIEGIGQLTIRTKNVAFDEHSCLAHPDMTPGDYVLLTVTDTGCGIDKETLAHVFEPFFTTKNVGEGTGLGLATVYGIMQQNNGIIEAFSEPGKGTTFNLYFPRQQSPASHEQTIPPAQIIAYGHETILLVEDEAIILEMTATMLERLGYTVLQTNNPREAINIAKEYNGEIQLLITDVIMPEINGADLAEQLTSHCPGLKTLFMSGYTADVIHHNGILDEKIPFLQKPFQLHKLASKIRETLDRD